MRAGSSAVLQVVAGDKTWSAAVAADDLGLPPAIVLQAQDGEDVAFAEGEFFRDGGLVHVHCAGCRGELVGGRSHDGILRTYSSG